MSNRLKTPSVFSVLLASAVGSGAIGNATAVQGPSFSCDAAKTGSIEEMICNDTELAALDRRLAEVYAAAQKKATNERPPVLKAEQRGWIKGRNECWKSDDKRGCVESEYRQRVAELRATSVQKQFTTAKRVAGVRKFGGIHTLWHAYATHQLEAAAQDAVP